MNLDLHDIVAALFDTPEDYVAALKQVAPSSRAVLAEVFEGMQPQPTSGE